MLALTAYIHNFKAHLIPTFDRGFVELSTWTKLQSENER